MTFQVEITATADQEADEILSLGYSPNMPEKLAGHWFLPCKAAIASLAEFPKRCPLAPENSAFPFEVRQLLYGKKPHIYRILFTIEDQTVYVLHIRHGRRAALRH